MAFTYVFSGGLLSLLITDKDYYRLGEPVSLVLTLTNISPRPVTLTYPTTQRYDFSVSGPGGVVWRWSADKTFAQFVQYVTLAPGESRRFSEVWPQTDNAGRQVPPGVYRVTGWHTFLGSENYPAPTVFITVMGARNPWFPWLP